MAPLSIRRICCGAPGASEELASLRTLLSGSGNVVSPRSQALTQKVFGAPLTPVQVVERICEDVRSRGREALFHYTRQFDQVDLTPQTVRVSAQELKNAHEKVDAEFLDTVRQVRQNVMAFQLGVLHRNAILSVAGMHQLQLRYRPMRRVGVLVPGGAAAYPSTLLMTICPAQAAGVKELAVVMPPTEHGANNPSLLAVCHELGVTEVYRIGGAQAVATLAYGVEDIAPVDMIVGPGNLFVALAKRHVYGQVAIDCIAGPSEVIILADDTAPPQYVAADLIAQAEHSPGSSILITWDESVLDEVARELERQLVRLSRGDLARDSLERFGALVLARNIDEALELTNRLGPEHLEIITREPAALGDRIDNAGAIFLGPYSPVAIGDYAAGPSHVLPTGGTARFTSGLSACDFQRRSSVLTFTKEGLGDMAEDAIRLADVEGLTAHAASVAIRVT
ncbi:MAG: histidinol dehydrogenase [Gemmataceae bacterium]